MNTRLRWATMTLTALAVLGVGGVAATGVGLPGSTGGTPIAATTDGATAGPRNAPAPAPAQPTAEGTGADAAHAADGEPRYEGKQDTLDVDNPTPGALSWAKDIGGIAPTPPAPVTFDFGTRPQEQHGPGKDAAAGDGYSSGMEGCELECIHTAKVSATGTTAAFTVRTHVPTKIWVLITGLSPQDSGYGLTTDFSPTFTGLSPNTRYDATIVAEDADGNARHIFGSFRTSQRKALVTFHKVHVIGDADNGGLNKGEIRFQFRVNDVAVASRSEDKLTGGQWVTLSDGRGKPGTMVTNAPKKLFVAGHGVERDCRGRFVFGSPGIPSPDEIEAGQGGSCWDVAAAMAGFDLDAELAGREQVSFTRVIGTDRHKLKFDVVVKVDVWHE